ncbi:MAG: Vitamin K-dependent protein [Myxococcaceae bacterium]|nr:Vitamin K-dependent protein [Myxococcaceae bacterium]
MTSEAIAGGSRDQGDPNVVLLISWNGSNPTGTLNSCTAEVVAPDVLLTAAHCLSENKQYYAAFLGADATVLRPPIDPSKSSVSAQLHMAREVHTHPQYVTTQGYYDVGVVILQESLTGVTPLPINRTAPTPSLLSDVSIVGYGKTYDGDSTFAVTKYRADGLSATLDPTNTMTVGNSVQHACVGDSGGPVLANIHGIATILGTDSYSDETGAATRCRMPSHYQRVDPYLSFLDQYVPRVAADAGIGPSAVDAGHDAAVAGHDAGSNPSHAGHAGDAGRADGPVGITGATTADPTGSSTGSMVRDAGRSKVDPYENDAGAQAEETDAEPHPSSDGCSLAQPSETSTRGVFTLVMLALILSWPRRQRIALGQDDADV